MLFRRGATAPEWIQPTCFVSRTQRALFANLGVTRQMYGLY